MPPTIRNRPSVVRRIGCSSPRPSLLGAHCDLGSVAPPQAAGVRRRKAHRHDHFEHPWASESAHGCLSGHAHTLRTMSASVVHPRRQASQVARASTLGHRLMGITAGIAFVLLLAASCSSSPIVGVAAQKPPPYPNTGYGLPKGVVWGPGTLADSASNPLNNPTAARDGSGGNSSSCNVFAQSNYVFNSRENYQQLITFFPIQCTFLRVTITQVMTSVSVEEEACFAAAL